MLFAQISDVVWQALIAGAVTVILAWLQQRNKVALEKKVDDAAAKGVEATKVNTDKISKVEEKVEVIHLATNSMKDAIVAVTERAAMSEGREAGRIQEKAETRAATSSSQVHDVVSGGTSGVVEQKVEVIKAAADVIKESTKGG